MFFVGFGGVSVTRFSGCDQADALRSKASHGASISHPNEELINNRYLDAHASHSTPWQLIPRGVDGQAPNF